MKSRLVYSEKYDFKLSLLNKLHPFDGEKYSKAWEIILSDFKGNIDSFWLKPFESISNDLLSKIHGENYLKSLNNSSTISKVVELWFLKFLPNKFLQNKLIEPMKWACNGTLIAAEKALTNNEMIMNLGGGYHHAFANHGEGFCFFADAALSIINCRDKKLLNSDDTILMIDLDAHRGNGFESFVKDDVTVKNFDMYGFQTYPGIHEGDIDEFPYMIPLKSGMNDETYLNILNRDLVKFLDEHNDAKLVFYNAGNDILMSDPLGGLNISYDGVVNRDKFVIEELTKRNIPTVIMTSGGYTKDSHKLIADLAKTVIDADKASR